MPFPNHDDISLLSPGGSKHENYNGKPCFRLGKNKSWCYREIFIGFKILNMRVLKCRFKASYNDIHHVCQLDVANGSFYDFCLFARGR